MEVKIVDLETRRHILPRGQIGAIAIRKHHKWYYLNDEQKWRDSHDDDGYFYQGDMARMQENGYIEIIGREDDMISVGNVKVFPTSIEMKLCQHPSVDKAIVFGVPDLTLGEVIGAAVLLKPGHDNVTSSQIIHFFRDSVQSDQKLITGPTMTPKFVWIEEAFPFTVSGKLDKKKVRASCLERFKN